MRRMLTFRPHEIGVAVGFRRPRRPRVPFPPANIANLRLRTKLLLSFVLLSAGLTCATLLIVRQSAAGADATSNRAGCAQRHTDVSGHGTPASDGAEPESGLAGLVAYMRNGDTTAIEDASDDPWKSDDCNLFALADKNGKIVSLHSTNPAFPVAVAEEMLRRSLSSGSTSAWWVDGKERLSSGPEALLRWSALKGNLLGTVVVGRSMDARAASELGRISSSQIIFRYGKDVVVSTLSPCRSRKACRQLQERDGRRTGLPLENRAVFRELD